LYNEKVLDELDTCRRKKPINLVARLISAAKQQIPQLGSKFHALRKAVVPGL